MKTIISCLILASCLSLSACGYVVIPRSKAAIANDCENVYKGDKAKIEKCLSDRRRWFMQSLGH